MTPSTASTTEDWTDPLRVPLGHAHEARGGSVTPEGIQANLFTLVQIGGIYDLLALEVERQHESVLGPWRLVSGAPRAVDYLVARDRKRSETNQTREESNAPSIRQQDSR